MRDDDDEVDENIVMELYDAYQTLKQRLITAKSEAPVSSSSSSGSAEWVVPDDKSTKSTPSSQCIIYIINSCANLMKHWKIKTDLTAIFNEIGLKEPAVRKRVMRDDYIDCGVRGGRVIKNQKF